MSKLSILKNDLSILKSELNNYESSRSHFSSKEQIENMIRLKEAEILKLTLKPNKKDSE